MIKVVKDNTYNYVSMFNTKTGSYIRMGDELMAEYPHLIDIGIMGHCAHGKTGLCMKAGIQCYQDGLHSSAPNMSLDNYKKIIDQAEKKLFQVALGGCGDPDMHENFEEILEYTCSKNIVPNFTTSGFGMTSEKAQICKKYCGAVAVSMYSRLSDTIPELALRRLHVPGTYKTYRSVDDIPVKFTFGGYNPDCVWDAPEYKINGLSYAWDELHHMYYSDEPQEYEFYRVYNEAQEPNYTMKAIHMLLKAGVKTNIHYVVSNKTIDEAIIRLKYNGFPNGINAVIFLLHKPVGLGDVDGVLDYNDPRVAEFFKLTTSGSYPFKIGFDSCSVPGILNLGSEIDVNSIDTCEGARFSMYISADMKALPCSFDNQKQKYAVQLSDEVSIKDAWDSEQFNQFRKKLTCSCPDCSQKELCMGGCPLEQDIVLCNSDKKELFVDGV